VGYYCATVSYVQPDVKEEDEVYAVDSLALAQGKLQAKVEAVQICRLCATSKIATYDWSTKDNSISAMKLLQEMTSYRSPVFSQSIVLDSSALHLLQVLLIKGVAL
jgi:hypothetical protein